MSLTLAYPPAACAEGRLYMARAIVTAPVIFSTAAVTGGPLLWNGTTKVTARLWKLSYLVSTASTVAGGIGLTGGFQGATAPTSTTAIDTSDNLLIGMSKQNPSQMSAFRIGTPAAAGTFFLPIAEVSTTALTALGDGPNWVDLDGSIMVPPGAWVSVAGSATLTTAVMQIALVWEELSQP